MTILWLLMFVHLKQSGELLASQGAPHNLWTPEGVRISTEKVATAWRYREELGMKGLLLVSGAGNIVRGEQLSETGIANGYADVLGRLGTIQNTIVLATALRERKVPVKTFIAQNMMLRDETLNEGEFEPYSIDAAREAYDARQVVLVGGGTGEDGKTTDNAVLAYAAHHSEVAGDETIVVLKGTKFDGVFDSDPQKSSRAQRFAEVTAGYMIKHYDTMAAVDRSCLDTINESGVSMRVYRDGQHDLTSVLRDGDGIGTLIVPGDGETEPRLAS